MPSPAYELGLALDNCGILSITDLLEHLRGGPLDLAELLESDATKAAVAAAVVMASVQTETATATVGTTMDSIVNVREVGSVATFSTVTPARMVNFEVQCSPSPPLTVQRAVQATPARVVTRNAASCTISWHKLEQNAMTEMRANAREEDNPHQKTKFV